MRPATPTATPAGCAGRATTARRRGPTTSSPRIDEGAGGQRLADAQRAPAGARGRAALRDRLHHRPAIDFMREQGDRPWVLHLSYVKPHWPYMAPAPYHAMYTADQCLPVVKRASELRDAHPCRGRLPPARGKPQLRARRGGAPCAPRLPGPDHPARRPPRPPVRLHGRQGLSRDTLVVFCADHGDFLGDHWLGEKELFYDTVQRVPFIVADPRRRGRRHPRHGRRALRRMRGRGAHGAGHPRRADPASTASRAAACCRCCTARRRPGATSSTASWTTASRAPAGAGPTRRSRRAPSRSAPPRTAT
jgi:hypothetical protein